MIDINIGNIITPAKEKLILGNSAELVIQQVDILFGTDIYDVLGDDFGTNYDKYLYVTGMSNSALEHKILSDLNKLDLLGFVPSVKVTLLEGTVRDIALIDITFTGDYETFNKIYKIE
jgi:hypothetical protein